MQTEPIFAVAFWILSRLHPLANMAAWIGLNRPLYANIVAILRGHPLGRTYDCSQAVPIVIMAGAPHNYDESSAGKEDSEFNTL
jgi:hypothetical protein